MSRRIRENRWRSSVTHWVCRMIGHRFQNVKWLIVCDRCGRFW